MKFVHAADFHIGATPEAGRPWERERASAVETSLSRVIELCNDEDADLLIIPGDLFNRAPLRKDLKEAAYQFAALKRAEVVIIAGNHDYLEEGSLYQIFDLGTHVHLISSATIDSVYFDRINTEVHGFSYHDRTIMKPMGELKAPQDGRIHVLMLHGGDAEHLPLSIKALSESGFDYVALGHIHMPKVYKGTHVAYCGSPEPLDITDIGDRGCLVGEVTGDTFSLKWVRLADTRYRQEQIELTPEMTESEIKDIIRNLQKEGPLDLLELKLTGRHDPELGIDIKTIEGMGRICRITDESIPDYDLQKLMEDHREDMIGRYIRCFENRTDEISRKALYYGLEALMKQK